MTRVMWAGLMAGSGVAIVATAVVGLAEATAVLMPIGAVLVLSGVGGGVAMVWARGRQ